MARLLVAGLINVETTLRVDDFPLHYHPVHYAFRRVHSSVSGVGYNVAKALHTLGHEVRLLSLIGRDAAAGLVEQALREDGLDAALVRADLEETAQSVILYDASGRRQIHVDLKDIQERVYPRDLFQRALAGCDAAVLCNINFARPFLADARAAGVLVATDVHALTDLHDVYNRDFMAHADLLAMSGDLLPESPEAWAGQVWQQYHPRALIIGLGDGGALLKTDAAAIRVPAVPVRPVVSTIGAGDALFSAFLHGYLQDGDALRALRQAVLFAAHKIGDASAARGFLTADALAQLARRSGAA